jgi:predicted nucleic acid-binding protein
VTVVDASAVVELLAPSHAPRRDFVLAQLPEPALPWLAPDVLPFEVFAVIRRYVLRKTLGDEAGARALRRLRALPIELVPTASLLGGAWKLRDRFAAADSLYATLALRAHEPLLTGDTRLARAAVASNIEVRAVEG